MFNIEKNNKTEIFFIGDIHGEFKSIANWIKTQELHDCILIFCGDFGVGFSSTQKDHEDLLRADRVCDEFNVDCYALRGNHDDPDYYNDSNILDLSRFKLVSDYSVISCPEHTILCLGGAISTDRSYRKSVYEAEIMDKITHRHLTREQAIKKTHKFWWEGEHFTYDESKLEEIIYAGFNVDVVCSHSAPIFCKPLTSIRVMNWCAEDENLEADIKNERESLKHVVDYLKKHKQPLANWFYGHYHEHNTETIDGVTYNGLDMGRNGRMSGSPGGLFDMKQLH